MLDFWGNRTKSCLCLILLFAVLLGFYSNVFSLIPRRQTEKSQSSPEAHHVQGRRESLTLSEGDGHLDSCRIPEVPRLLYPKAQLLKPLRVDVLVMTPWFAPVVWDGTFDSALLDVQFRNTTIGLTVFAIKKFFTTSIIWEPLLKIVPQLRVITPEVTVNLLETGSSRRHLQYQPLCQGVNPTTAPTLVLRFPSLSPWEAKRLLLSSPRVYVVFLRLFLETAEKYFMVGHKVIYYVFTDRPADVPQIALQDGRQVVVLHVGNYRRWQDISMHRMEMISNFSRRRFLREVDYLVCLYVDMKFSDHVGVEILAPLFGTLHPGFYAADRQSFTYERRPLSRAYIPRDEGDFYYAGGFFGGSVPEVYRLTTACHQAMTADQAQGIEAVWHDESHLNRYLLSHKPSKVLSPEYLWDEQMLQRPPLLRKLRYVAVPMNHTEIRSR
ncbi:histo-blood group ABO system transferase isoform X2 [Bos taurus]|uniref:histo-blood group ABO system transferase isoform X2 n=1 Tax=Bos taurus TaxID=9913 RepID=UPI0028CB3B22|nr:histo-blood group ABO system transferase isoform X2 [Bos taurus]